jgi:hypothetical protein
MEELEQPKEGWCCFHCGDVFKTIGSARDHFGFEPSSDPACRIKIGTERGLIMALRKTEKLLAEALINLHNEGSDAMRALRSAQIRYREQIIDAEELGYSRGLNEGRKYSIQKIEE